MTDKPEKVIIAVYPKTRRRINTFAAMKGMTQMDYVDSVVPELPGEKLPAEKPLGEKTEG